MNILALETALTEKNSLTLIKASETHSFSLGNTYALSKTLIPSIEAFLTSFDMNYSDLGGLSVITGPGSFTGIRVGISAAQGLSLANSIPLVGISTFEAWKAFAISQADLITSSVLILVDSKRDDPYYALYSQDWELISPPQTLNLETLQELQLPSHLSVIGDLYLTETFDRLKKIGIHTTTLPQDAYGLSYWAAQVALKKLHVTPHLFSPQSCIPTYVSQPQTSRKI